MPNEAVVFRGGMPYGPDIKKLNESFPLDSLAEGLVLTHEKLEKAVGYRAGTSRYYAVVKSWIGRQRAENRIFIVFEPKIGVKVLNPAEVMEYAEKSVRQKIGQTGKAVRIFNWVERERLDSTGQKRFDHQTKVVGVIRQSLEAARKELAIELSPIKSLPRPAVR